MFCNSYILYYYHDLGSLKKTIFTYYLTISVGHLSEFNFTEFSIFRAEVSCTMSAGEGFIWGSHGCWQGLALCWSLDGRFYFLDGYQLKADLSSLPYVPLHRAAPNMAAYFIKASKIKNLLARCKSEFYIIHSQT